MHQKKMAIITTTRAEYGLLSPIIKELRKYESADFHVDLIVSGTHLCKEYGDTINEILVDNVRIDKTIPVSVKSESAQDISNNQAEIIVKFTKAFAETGYNSVLILGDRYETLAIAIAAVNTLTPIIHVCGGDISEGAVDDCIRHSITKMSHYHFATNEESKNRIIQMGENPKRVYNFGSTSIDNILLNNINSKEEALKSVGLNSCQYAICTYHPVTLERNEVKILLKNIFDALSEFPQFHYIITKSNADLGGGEINRILESEVMGVPNIHVFSSLGVKRYLSLMRYAEFVIGNSSSGIIEAPALHIPTVNIGNRQKGRLRAPSIIDCGDSSEEIASAIQKAISKEFIDICKKVESPYGDGHASKRIAAKIYNILSSEIEIKKSFYNINL